MGKISILQCKITWNEVNIRNQIFCALFFIVPGCNMVWKAQDNFCFLVSANYSSTENKLKEYCQKNEGDLYYATNKSAFRLLEQFLYTIVSNANGGKSSQCIVVGLLNASSFSNLPLTQQNKSNSMTHICATRLPSQWKLQGCLVNSCDHLCIAPRGEGIDIEISVFHFTKGRFPGGRRLRRGPQ